MGSSGSQGPRPFQQAKASTVFLRVPSVDWIGITHGLKSEFRASPAAVTQALNLDLPTAVVAYRQHPQRGYDAKLMVLEETWQEPLGAISAESLEREGFSDLAHFRRYWIGRERRRFAPTRKVRVFRVRPWKETDREVFADRLFERLYGGFAPEADE